MRVCVFCSSSPSEDSFVAPAVELGARLGRAGHTLVWGGSDTGLMKALADSAEQAGAPLIGISMEVLRPQVRSGATRLLMASSLAERKRLFVEESDLFVAMPGGLGTLDELTHVLELKKHGLHSKEIIVLNVGGFYDGLQLQFEAMDRASFLAQPISDLLQVVASPIGVLEHIDGYSGRVPGRLVG